MLGLLLLQVTFLSAASDGEIVAMRVNSSPSVSVAIDWLRVIFSTVISSVSNLPKYFHGEVVLYLLKTLAGICKVAFGKNELSKVSVFVEGTFLA